MDIKSVVVTGGKAVFNPVIEGDDSSGEKKRLARRTRKQPVAYRVTGKLDGDGTLILPPSTDSGAATITPIIAKVVPLAQPTTEIKKISVNPSHTEPSPVSGGSSQPVVASSPNTKVLLGGKKPHRVKVLLTKKRHVPQAVDASAAAALKAHKPARKIQLGVGAIKKNVTRAKRITRVAKTLPIETIRAELVKAGIIKESSKAPEAVLRQMYADAKTVSTRSL
jgi:hypothetical protein